MRKEKKILIVSVLNHLKKRDPAWGLPMMESKFKQLYECWAAGCVRHHKHNKVYFSRKWKEGWLPYAEYLDFFMYAMQ